jgi:hypothetical protein
MWVDEWGTVAIVQREERFICIKRMHKVNKKQFILMTVTEGKK